MIDLRTIAGMALILIILLSNYQRGILIVYETGMSLGWHTHKACDWFNKNNVSDQIEQCEKLDVMLQNKTWNITKALEGG